MERPVGITILAVLNFLAAVFWFLAAGVFVLGPGQAIRGSEPVSAAALTSLAALGPAGGIVLLLFAAINVIVGIGMWKLRHWARTLYMVFTGFAVAACALGMLTALAGADILMLLFNAALTLVYVWMLWYLLRPHVKKAFGVS
jgi:hypothetical protein